MPKIYGHTWLILAVTATLIVLASVFTFSSHEHLLESEKVLRAQKAEHLADYLGRSIKLIDGDTQYTNWLVESARLYDDLAYLVLTDNRGKILAAINEPGARRAGYNFPSGQVSGSEIEKWSFPIVVDSLMDRTLYLGMTPQAAGEGVKSDRRAFVVAGIILFAIALILMLSFARFNQVEKHLSSLQKVKRELASEKGTLESKVSEHQEKEVKLKKSEERYKKLLESTMQSAFNDLEKRKHELEIEVEERTNAQRVLKKYADRLSALNSIEGMLVEETALEDVVQHALEQLQGLIKLSRASVVRLDADREVAMVLAQVGQDFDGIKSFAEIPIENFRPFNRGLFVSRDLGKLPERAPIEEALIKDGMNSYCRITLTVGETIAGALNVGSLEKGAFDEETLKIIRDVADLLSIAFRQNMHKEEQSRYESELIAERDRAEEMARLKTAFLTNMSHEIRTPLSGIIGFAQVLHEEVPKKHQEFTGLIQDAAKRLLLTINSVLDLSKLEANKEALSFRVLDVSQVVSETARVLDSLAERKGLSIEVIAENEVPARLDRNAIEAIVNNLVGNAIKFTSEGSINISVMSDANLAVIEVADTGVGISDEFLPHLFDEFRQEHMDVDRPHQGSGLGLAITSRLVTKMGGRINVKSKVGEGTVFRVSFPTNEQEKATDRKATASKRSKKKTSGDSAAKA